GANSTGLLPLLENFSETLPSHEVATLAPTHNLALAVAEEGEDVVYAAALLGAHLSAHGSPGTWSARFQRTHRVRFGRLLPPELIALPVEGGALSYETAAGERRSTVRSAGAEGIVEIPAADLGGGRAILVPDLDAVDALAIRPKEGHSQNDIKTRVYEVEK